MEVGPKLPGALLRFAKWTREMRFDVIHAHHRRLAALANAVQPLSGVPVLYTSHSTFSNASWFRALSPRSVTGVSPSVVGYLHRCTRAIDISLIYNPYVFQESPPAQRSIGGYHAVTVGRLDPVKGHETLIEAWCLLKKRGSKAKLDIFGEGPLRAALKAKIEGNGLTEMVRLRGFEPDVIRRFSDYAFSILASQKEGFPNVVIEAAAQGLPTLLTDVDGSRDALPPNLRLPNCLPSGDAHALSDAIATWFESPKLVQEDGRSFHDYLKRLCAPDVIGKQYLAAYPL